MELAAVGRDEFVQGFKLAGVRKTFSVARDQLEAQVAKVLEDANVGILILSADDMGALSHSLRHRLETTPRPVVIAVMGGKTVIQVYEDTSGVKPGEAVLDTGAPLVVELGPGLLGSIYDGVQRPLPILQKVMGDFILRGVKSPGLTREKSWRFNPRVKQARRSPRERSWGPCRKRRTSSIGSWSRRTSAAGRSPNLRRGRSRSTRLSSSWTTESR